MASPPKPWERAGGAAAAEASSSAAPAASSGASSSGSTTAVPSVPSRPSSIAASQSQSPYSNPLTSQFNSYSSPYSSYSPYNRLGSSMYGGYGGGYNSMYGGMGMSPYGAGYGGMGGMGGMYGGMGYGMGMNPQGFDPNNPSLTQQLESTTQSTFALLQSIVQTFGGFAQMLESTFMATHSSFFAMVGVAEQFGQLRNALGSVLGLFGLIRWLRGVITGRHDGGMGDDFTTFVNRPPGAPPLPPRDPNAPKPSKKPIIFFLLAIFGIPYLMRRLIRHLQTRLPPPPPQGAEFDPSKLVFARTAYAFDSKDPIELALKHGEIVAVLGTTDPLTGIEGEWWRGRTREGREGWFPKAFVEVLPNTKAQPEAKKVV